MSTAGVVKPSAAQQHREGINAHQSTMHAVHERILVGSGVVSAKNDDRVRYVVEFQWQNDDNTTVQATPTSTSTATATTEMLHALWPSAKHHRFMLDTPTALLNHLSPAAAFIRDALANDKSR
jgi:hypothetical protein